MQVVDDIGGSLRQGDAQHGFGCLKGFFDCSFGGTFKGSIWVIRVSSTRSTQETACKDWSCEGFLLAGARERLSKVWVLRGCIHMQG